MRVIVLVLAACLALVPGPLNAQRPATGRVVGRVTDEATGAPVSGAVVGVAAGGVQVSSGIDGRYTLLNMPTGRLALAIRAIGYAPKTVGGVGVTAGEVTVQDVVLSSQAVELAEITVAAAAQGSAAQALEEQRFSLNIVNAISIEQIARSPDGDAGQAVQRISGVAVQDGRYVIVRGLGERYTTTSLNSARLPSPEPDRKVVPLDLFPANLLQAVTASKTFTPDQPGDFSGAQVNLQTREFDRGRVLTWSTSTGWNSAATFRTLPAAPRTGMEWLGFAGGPRRLPAAVREAGNLTGVTSSQMSALIGAFRNTWSPGESGRAPSGSVGVSLGGEDPIFGRLVGYVGSLTYSNGTDVRRDEERALAVADAGGRTRPQNEYHGETVTSSVLWGGILNLTTRVGVGTKFSFDNTYSRGGDNSVVRAFGHNEEFQRDFDITRLSFVARSVRSNQLRGEHLFARAHTVSWAITSSGVTRDEPDRSDLVYEARRDSATGAVTPLRWWGGPRSGNRTFSTLRENGWQGDLNWQWALGPTLSVKAGGQYRSTDRSADTRSYDIVNVALDDAELQQSADRIFRQTDKLSLLANALGGSYDAGDHLWAGYALVEFPLTRRLRVTGGARVEHSAVRVATRTPAGALSVADPVTTDVLPALAVTVAVRENVQLRFAASQTLSRPEYRELSGVCYFEILGGLTVCGNDALHRALIRNFDARWEWFPASGEVVSLGAFAKDFTDPIERILVGTTGATTAGFVNTAGATNWGVEFEVRKNLGFVSRALQPFALEANATVMRSRIRIGADRVASLTNADRPMVGQSPYVLNLGFGYAAPRGTFSATVLYNIVGERIVEAGTLPLPDTYEDARPMLDAALRVSLRPGVSVKLDAKNLLDTPVRITQGQVTRSRYTVGRSVSVGVSIGS